MTDQQQPNTAPADDWTPRGVDTQTPSTARMYDYYLGGKHHYPADRQAAEKVLAAIPDVATAARENRKFLQRTVRVMAESGIRQFVDLGAGLPTQQNVHQVAQAVDPGARTVYVDHDPVALAHARALLATDNQTAVVDADLRRPREVLPHPDVGSFIDFDEPVGLLLVAILHFTTDDEGPADVVAGYREALAPGSQLAISHASNDDVPADAAARGSQVYDQATSTITLRTSDEIRRLFPGLEILDPGVVRVDRWRPHLADASGTTPAPMVGGLGRRT